MKYLIKLFIILLLLFSTLKAQDRDYTKKIAETVKSNHLGKIINECLLHYIKNINENKYRNPHCKLTLITDYYMSGFEFCPEIKEMDVQFYSVDSVLKKGNMSCLIFFRGIELLDDKIIIFFTVAHTENRKGETGFAFGSGGMYFTYKYSYEENKWKLLREDKW